VEFARIAPRGWLEGPALMEVEAPDVLLRPVQDALVELAARTDWPRGQVAVTPRFAPNVTAAGLRACAEVAARAGAPVQSHLSENPDEVAWVRSLFPRSRDYTAVYGDAGLLGPRTVMAHGIHLSDDELARLAQTGTLIAHCPTSNEALGSGRMPLERLRAAGVAWALATDVGAGPLVSQIDTIAVFLEVHAGHTAVTAAEALCRATAVPGAWLSQFDSGLAGLGTLAAGAPAHVVALPRPAGVATPDADAETWLRRLVATPRQHLETLPEAVWCWGEAVVFADTAALDLHGPRSLGAAPAHG
jgi:guanine deaminase